MDDLNLDFTREERQGFAEVVYGEMKSADQLERISAAHVKEGVPMLITRMSGQDLEPTLKTLEPAGELKLSKDRRTLSWFPAGFQRPPLTGRMCVVSAGSWWRKC